ncbi:hypothetical protein CPB83DRAFT_755063 [Crepidotus variabilis]|uniref:RlpA-like protein double-psi beta-barrel domain-containing protein n=1 Tax=Crepidotus variabilis TaxID=179855 RepID=A0A9P6JWN3_9AGAR|nr:hypothetical protein CPB83DRAFT_755063 [Crepidotus variabilis]
MIALCIYYFVLLLAYLGRSTTATRTPSSQNLAAAKYSTAHSLGDGYQFDPRDGWEAINMTDLQYKYKRSPGHSGTHDSSKSHKPGIAHIGKIVASSVDRIFKGLKGIGKPEPVIITWYTGHDLKNPSCWSDGNWAPTDNSFACALTMEGWKGKPKCFKFLELCNTPKKCVFVRVVDTCAGCAPGSKHVDLTKAAFKQLADLDEGKTEVQCRGATEPDTWVDRLWGPKVHHN